MSPVRLPRSRSERRDIVEVARAMAAGGLVPATAGNVSRRTSRGILITPTRRAYRSMRRRDLILLDGAGTRISGRHEPSREVPLHLAIYGDRPDVGAIIHTHSPYATAWSFRGLRLPDSEDLEYLGVGPVQTSPPAPAGSEALAGAVAGSLGESKATLIGEHGVVAVGADPWEALEVAEVVEAAARVAWILSGRVAEPPAGAPRPGTPSRSRATP
jgi:ribulose-5-phosphate 4-epimerase/fuculose-1-phosphate aldolase